MNRRLWCVLFAWLCSGCSSFAETEVAEPGRTARVTLGTSRIKPDGSEEPILVVGRVVSSSLGAGPVASLTLEQRTSQPVGNFREFVTMDTVSIPQPDIRRLEVERFSWIRSSLALVVLGAAIRVGWQKFAPSSEVR